MLELAVQVVQLQHQEVWLVVLDVILRGQVDGHIDLVLDLNHQAQVLHAFSLGLREFEEVAWDRLELLILDVQIEYIEHWQACCKRVVEVLQSLARSLRDLLVRIEELDDRGDPSQNLGTKDVHIVHGKDFEDVLQHEPDALRLSSIEDLVRGEHVPGWDALLIHDRQSFLDVVQARLSRAHIGVHSAEVEVRLVELEYVAQKDARLQLVHHVLCLERHWPDVEGVDPADEQDLLEIGQLLVVQCVRRRLLLRHHGVDLAPLLHISINLLLN